MKAKRKGTKREQLLVFRLNKVKREWRACMEALAYVITNEYEGSAERFDQAMTTLVRDMQRAAAEAAASSIFEKGVFLGMAK